MSELVLPKIDRATINKKEYIFKNLAKIINPENVLSHADEIKPYETDALAAYTQTPLAVVMPENTEEVSNILKFCHKENIKVVPRGAGTGLSGGALPLNDAILISLGKFNKIIEIDLDTITSINKHKTTITYTIYDKIFKSIGQFEIYKKQPVKIISKIKDKRIDKLAYRQKETSKSFFGVMKFSFLLLFSILGFLISAIFLPLIKKTY